MGIGILTPTTLPPRPPMPRQEDQDRAEYQMARWLMLKEKHGSIVEEWLVSYIDPDILKKWGEPDISYDLVAAYAKQLTTPGRYWKRPTLTHPDPSAEGLIGPKGAIAKAGYWTKMQRIEYFTIGIGDYLVHVSVDSRGSLVYRPVAPHNVILTWDEENPDRLVQVLELRVRWSDPEQRWHWAWDVYDISDPKNPSWRVLSATETEPQPDGTMAPMDLSSTFLVHADGESTGALVGAAYPFRDDDTGDLFIPYGHHSSADVIGWNIDELRGLHRATLHATTYATYAGRTALDATGPFSIVYGLEIGADIRFGEDGTPTSAGEPVRTIPITPGMVLSATAIAEKVGKLDFNAGVNLPALSKFVETYTSNAMRLRGLGGADAQKQAANPTSGSALYISDKGRREYSTATNPIFHRDDLGIVVISALVLNAFTGTSYPTDDDYSLVYAHVPLSPQEEANERDEDEWKLKMGLKSRVDIMIERNPGLSREQAIERLRRVHEDEAAIAAANATTEPDTEEEAA